MAYTHVAVFIHWLTALFIIGLLAVGKFMTGLAVDDSLRFTLTQYHKTFGILVLALSAIRILWRLTHRAPAHPEHAPAWEKFAAGLSHLAFYALILIMPLSGWAMVSVSSLNIDTLLFNRIELPHLPLLTWLNITETADKDAIEHTFHSVHHVAANILLVLLIVHIGAALKHHYIDKDDVLRRMRPRITEPGFLGLLALVAVMIGASVYALGNFAQSSSAPLSASGSTITLTADVTSTPTPIVFAASTVVANIDVNNPSASSLEATVETGTATSDNLQVQNSLPGSDWFDSANYPTASFVADGFKAGQQVNTLDVTGLLNVKDNSVPVSFTLTISAASDTEPAKASAYFSVDRTALEIGLESQPDDDYIGPAVEIRVDFDLSAER